jgi:hypothetical protein
MRFTSSLLNVPSQDSLLSLCKKSDIVYLLTFLTMFILSV